MICYDNDNWDEKSALKGKWYCPDCTKGKGSQARNLGNVRTFVCMQIIMSN